MLEDDQRLRSVVVRGLHRAGHTVDAAATVEDARWFISETSHNVLIFDVMLPDGDGFTFCREVRAAHELSASLTQEFRATIRRELERLVDRCS